MPLLKITVDINFLNKNSGFLGGLFGELAWQLLVGQLGSVNYLQYKFHALIYCDSVQDPR